MGFSLIPYWLINLKNLNKEKKWKLLYSFYDGTANADYMGDSCVANMKWRSHYTPYHAR